MQKHLQMVVLEPNQDALEKEGRSWRLCLFLDVCVANKTKTLNSLYSSVKLMMHRFPYSSLSLLLQDSIPKHSQPPYLLWCPLAK